MVCCWVGFAGFSFGVLTVVVLVVLGLCCLFRWVVGWGGCSGSCAFGFRVFACELVGVVGWRFGFWAGYDKLLWFSGLVVCGISFGFSGLARGVCDGCCGIAVCGFLAAWLSRFCGVYGVVFEGIVVFGFWLAFGWLVAFGFAAYSAGLMYIRIVCFEVRACFCW